MTEEEEAEKTVAAELAKKKIADQAAADKIVKDELEKKGEHKQESEDMISKAITASE